MNIRRNVLTVICILSLSMIVSGCTSEENRTENKQEALSIPDVNDILVNEEEKIVEPKAIELLNTSIINKFGDSSKFEANIGNGKYIRLSFKSYNNATINIKIEVNRNTYRVIKLSASNQSEVVDYTISATSDFRLVYESTNGTDLSLDVIAKQYEVLP